MVWFQVAFREYWDDDQVGQHGECASWDPDTSGSSEANKTEVEDSNALRLPRVSVSCLRLDKSIAGRLPATARPLGQKFPDGIQPNVIQFWARLPKEGRCGEESISLSFM